MPEEMLVDMIEKVQRHPWWSARAHLALAILQRNRIKPPASIYDVGCGWGTNLTVLETGGYAVTGVDISPRILARIDRPNRHLVEADMTQPLPPEAEPADALFALDVIEHIDDDSLAIRNMANLLKTGGVAIVSVPALPELYSRFDEIQGHRRRYLPDTLRAAFAGSGLAIRSIFWWGAWMVPVLRAMRTRASSAATYSDFLRLPPWPGSLMMKLAFAVERPLSLRNMLPMGTSLFAVAVHTEM
jgi:SAM-dependent methyltransferase